MHSPDLTQGNIAKIRELFPDCVTEATDENGKLRYAVDFDQLKQELSDHIVEGPQERFLIDWPGKREALLNANAPIAKTFCPSREESVDFDKSQHLFIEGDNLEALKLLQEGFLGKVKMIYIDPPYNTGNDFIYADDFCEEYESYLTETNQIGENGDKLIANTESNGRFHSDWLSMMYSRLRLARNMLSYNGLIFISIGDDEQANLKKLCDEVFGVNNFLGCAARISKKANNQGDYWSPNFDYILTYARDKTKCDVFFGGVNYDAYNQVDEDGPRAGERYQLIRLYMTSLDSMRGCVNQRYFIEAPDGTLLIPPGNIFPQAHLDGNKVAPETGEDKVWRWSRESYLAKKDEIIVRKVRSSNLVDANGDTVKWNVYTKTYLNDVIKKSSAKPNSLIEDHINQKSSQELNKLGIPFSFAKPSSLIEYLCEISRVGTDDFVMDFFAGSGSTAHGVLSFNSRLGYNAKYILVQLDEALDFDDKNQKSGFIFCQKHGFYENIPSLTKERIRRAGKKILEGECHESWNKDIGFRVLKIDTSNMADVYYPPSEVEQKDLLSAVDNVKPGRDDPEDLLFQVLVDWGVDLTLPIRRETIQSKTVFFVNKEPYDLVACFDTGITEELVKELAKHQPMRVVFRDNGFVSDAVKINAGQIFRQLSPATDVKSI